MATRQTDLDGLSPEDLAEALADSETTSENRNNDDESRDADPDQATPEYRDVAIGGQYHRVTKDVADALLIEQQSLTEALSRRDQAPAAAPVSEPTRDTDEDFATRFFSDPEAVLREREQKIREEVTTELRREYSAKTALDKYWDDFYRQNADLRDYKWVVDSVVHDRMSELENLRGTASMAAVARMTKERILEVGGKFGKSTSAEPKATTTLPGGRKEPPKAPAKAQEDNSDKEPISLSKAIAERRKKRKKSA
jgi:hypothetical protein